MNWKTLALSGVALGSMMLGGCPGGGGGTDSGMGGGTDSPMVTAPVSQTYIVGAINIPNGPDAMNRVPGFNLDGMNSDGSGTGCVGLTPDFTSTTGEAGTDNQFVGMLVGLITTGAMLDVQAAVSDQIANGSLLLAMRVNDINSFTADSSVTLELFLVKQGDCTMDTCAVTGGVMAGQAWRQRAASLTPTPLMASITGGQLRGSVPALPLSFRASGRDIALTIRNAQVGAGISMTGLTNGAIGGSLRVQDILDLAEMIMPGIGATVAPIIRQNADLDPMTGMPNSCDSISAGLGFTAVPAMTVAPL